MTLPKLMTQDEVAAYLGCTKITVVRERERGLLPSITVGGRLIRIREDELPVYLERKRRDSNSTETEKATPPKSGTSIGLSRPKERDTSNEAAINLLARRTGGKRR